MGNSNSLPAKDPPPPISTKAISVRTRFNTPSTQETHASTQNTQITYAWHAIPYAPMIAAYGHAMCCVDDKLIMVGGIRKYPAVNYGIIDLETKTCSVVQFKGAPVDWSGLTATHVGCREHDNYCYNELFSVDIRTRQINRHESDTEGRTGHTASLVGRNIYYFAGQKVVPSTTALLPCNDLVILDTGTQQWHKVNASGPSERHFHAAAAVGSLIFIHGGMGEASLLDDLWIFDTEKQIWSEAKIKGTIKPPPMSRHTMSAYGCRIFLFGTAGGSTVFFLFDAGRRLFILGGTPDNHTFLGDLHSLDVGEIFNRISPSQPPYYSLRQDMLEFLNNPLFSDLTLYINNNNSKDNTNNNNSQPIYLHKCIVFARHPEFIKYFMGNNTHAKEITINGFSHDVVFSAMQVLYSDWTQVKPQDIEEFTRFTTHYHLERVTQVSNPFDVPDIIEEDVELACVETQSLAQDLASMRSSRARADVIFVTAQGTNFHAHRAILAARSAYFRAMLGVRMRESCAGSDANAPAQVELGSEVDENSFEVVLRFLYAEPIDMTNGNIDLLGVLELCCRYLIEGLRVQIARFLGRNVDMDNVIALFEAAMVLDCPELKLGCMEFIGWHFEDVCRLKDFHAMNESHRSMVRSYYKLLNYSLN